MKLLICTQVVDSEDAALGFFLGWLEEFSKHFTHIHVVCLKEGKHTLPVNVTVHSLGKEDGATRWQNIKTFYAHTWRLRHDYDVVFVHMSVEYTLLGGLLWRAMGKKVGQWYVHGTVSWRLMISCVLANLVFTTTTESMRVPTRKKRIVGHGIDTDKFYPVSRTKNSDSVFVNIISNNRIAPAKRELEMVEVCEELYARGVHFNLTIVGGPATNGDKSYEARLRTRIAESICGECIVYRGPIPHEELPELMRAQNVALNFYLNNSLDKAGLEALASGVRLVSTNIAFKDILMHDGLYLERLDVSLAADAVVRAYNTSSEKYVAYVRHQHSLPALIEKVVHFLK